MAEPTHPRTTTTIHGHQQVREQIAHALTQQRIPHAYIFTGPRGVGKCTIAFDYARQLLGNTPEIARAIANNTCGNVLYICRTTNESGTLKRVLDVEEIRRISDFVRHTPHGESPRRVIIIDDADSMSPSAAAAVLKSLEEPPSQTYFVLIAHDIGRVLPTIRSRCRVQTFGLLPPDVVQRITGTPTACGSVFLANLLHDDKAQAYITHFATAVQRHDTTALTKCLRQWLDSKTPDLEQILAILSDYALQQLPRSAALARLQQRLFAFLAQARVWSLEPSSIATGVLQALRAD